MAGLSIGIEALNDIRFQVKRIRASDARLRNEIFPSQPQISPYTQSLLFFLISV